MEVTDPYIVRAVNQTLRSGYTLEQIRALSQDDIDAVLLFRTALRDRLNNVFKKPDYKKNPEVAILAEVLEQLL